MGAVWLVVPVVVVVAAVQVSEPLHVVAHQPAEQPRVPLALDGRGADDPRLEGPVIEAEVVHWLAAVSEGLVTIPVRKCLIPRT